MNRPLNSLVPEIMEKIMKSADKEKYEQYIAF